MSERLQISESAQQRIAALLQKEEQPEKATFRVAVDGGGCSGFQYKFDLENADPAEDDIVISQGDARVVIDSTSLEFLAGSVLDFQQALAGSMFVITNPNATAGCGCGNSFAI